MKIAIVIYPWPHMLKVGGKKKKKTQNVNKKQQNHKLDTLLIKNKKDFLYTFSQPILQNTDAKLTSQPNTLAIKE